VLILGMHRCGTSLTARIANLLGVDLGRATSMIPPGPDNPQGFWEQDPIRHVNDAIFEALGATWHHPPDMPTGWHRRAEIRALEGRARETLEAAGFDRTGAWGWKDPRTSLTLPFWRPLIGARTRCVVCVRSPPDVIASLLTREPDTHTPESAFDLWLRYTGAALRNTVRHPRLLVLYDDLLDRTEEETDRLAGFLGVETAAISPEAREQIRGFVNASLRHHSTPPARAARASQLPIEGRELYLALVVSRHLETDRAGRLVERETRRLIEPLRRAAPELLDAYQERRRASTGILSAIEERDSSREELQLLQEELVSAEARLQATLTELTTSRAKLQRLTEAHHRRGEQLKRKRQRQQLRKARRKGGKPPEAPSSGSGPPESGE
jgi:hypothetical protein